MVNGQPPASGQRPVRRCDGRRVLVNSTIGLGGALDPATGMDLHLHSEDFGGRPAIGRRPFDRAQRLVALRSRDQRAQIIPERPKRRIDLNVLGSQGNKRVKFQPKTGLADRLRHAVNDVVGPYPNVVVHRSVPHGPGQRHEERDWGSMWRKRHACIVQCSISF